MEQNKNKRAGNKRFRRSIYVLPNLVTALNMLCGFYAVVAAMEGNFIAAAYAVILAGIFDNLDGKIARATHSTSKFGVEFDSLADLISFGLAPGILMYLWALAPLGRLGWLAAFLFLACGALRLARFNIQAGTISSEFFIGLPIPAAAGMCAVTILFCEKVGTSQTHPAIFLALLYLLSFLMVSTIKYYSFKKQEFLRNKNFNILVTAILVLIFIIAQPSIALFFIAAAYTVSGPAMMIWHYQRLSGRPASDVAPEEEQSSSPI